MAREAIFIGYRRDDTADVAGRIYDALEARFGKERLFKDVDNIPPGVDFGKYIKSILPRCRVALILIGPHWVNARDAGGRRRLDDQNDWVRVEVETALSINGLQVVPVLVNGAQMPTSSDLPASLRPLMHLNAAIIRRDPDFRDDIARLANALRAGMRTGLLDLGSLGDDRHSSAPQRRGGAGGLLLGAVVGAAALGGVVYFSDWRPSWMLRAPQSESAKQTASVAAENLAPAEASEAEPPQPATQRQTEASATRPTPVETTQRDAPVERPASAVAGSIWRGTRSISTDSARFCSDWGATVAEVVHFRGDNTVSDGMMGAGTYAQGDDRIVVTHRWGGMDLRLRGERLTGTFRFNMSGAADADCLGTVDLTYDREE
jgi:hypothetical protein